MIEEDYVSFEIAKLLKKKGFNEKVMSFYPPGDIQRPTLQMAIKWLREKNIIIVIQPEYFNAESKCSAWGCDVWADDNYEKLQSDFPTYEQACETAIKYCLENLV